MEWRSIARSDQYRGRWVALDNVRYNPVTSQPIEGEVVDVDEDLAELCARMRASDRTSCAILFCEDDEGLAPATVRRPALHPRAAQH